MARVPLGGVGVHAEAGPGVDLDDGAPLLAHGAGDVGGDEVDAGHVEPDDHRRLPRDLDVVGVDVVGAVDRGAAGAHVAGQLELDEAAFLRHVVQRQLLLGQDLERLRVDGDAGEDLLVADAAAGILVGDLDQLGDGVRAVADDVSRHPLGDGDDLIVDDQDAIVLAGDEGLDDDVAAAALAARAIGIGLAHLRFVGEIDHHAAAMIAVERLQHDRVAEAAGGVDRLVDGADDGGARHGDADLVQQAVGQLLVAGDVDRDVGRLAGDGGPDPLLVGAVAELDERAAGIEAQDGDAAPLRLGDDGAGRGAVGESLGDPDDLLFQLARRSRSPARCRR